MAPTDCVAENGHHDLCDSSDRCITRGVWEKIRDGINNVIDNISLQELIDDYYRNNKRELLIMLDTKPKAIIRTHEIHFS